MAPLNDEQQRLLDMARAMEPLPRGVSYNLINPYTTIVTMRIVMQMMAEELEADDGADSQHTAQLEAELSDVRRWEEQAEAYFIAICQGDWDIVNKLTP